MTRSIGIALLLLLLSTVRTGLDLDLCPWRRLCDALFRLSVPVEGYAVRLCGERVEIQRVGVFRDRSKIPLGFVYMITHYNDSSCRAEQYSIQYEYVLFWWFME